MGVAIKNNFERATSTISNKVDKVINLSHSTIKSSRQAVFPNLAGRPCGMRSSSGEAVKQTLKRGRADEKTHRRKLEG